jgi:hypothetical protein
MARSLDQFVHRGGDGERRHDAHGLRRRKIEREDELCCPLDRDGRELAALRDACTSSAWRRKAAARSAPYDIRTPAEMSNIAGIRCFAVNSPMVRA